MSQASVHAFLANIASRQKQLPLPQVFRFKKVASGRKANGPLVKAVYPGDMSAEEAAELRASKEKKERKKRTTRKKGMPAVQPVAEGNTPAPIPAAAPVPAALDVGTPVADTTPAGTGGNNLPPVRHVHSA